MLLLIYLIFLVISRVDGIAQLFKLTPFVVVFIASIYQRPEVYTIWFSVFLYLAIYLVGKNTSAIINKTF